MIPFPDKKYSIIYADPPWSYSDSGCSGAAAAQYATMSINELKQLPVNPAGGGVLLLTTVCSLCGPHTRRCRRLST